MRHLWATLTAKAEAEGRKLYTFQASTDAVDRQGEVVSADGWELDNYRMNPVVLDSHNYSSIENIVGRAVDVRQTERGIEADIVFNDSPRGQLAQQLVEGGDLRAVSVGFQSKEMAFDRSGKTPPRHTRQELLEISTVPVPANSEALRVRAFTELIDSDIWDSVAAAMVALMSPGCELEDAARKRIYVGLERCYEAMGRTPPEFRPLAEIKSLGFATFYEGEEAVKAGRVLSSKNEGRLRQAATLIGEVLESLPQADGDGDQEPKAVESEMDIDIDALVKWASATEGV